MFNANNLTDADAAQWVADAVEDINEQIIETASRYDLFEYGCNTIMTLHWQTFMNQKMTISSFCLAIGRIFKKMPTIIWG